MTPAFTPGCNCPEDRADIRFRIKGPDAIDLDIVDADGERVRRIAADRTLENRVPALFHWDGSTDAGKPAPPGTYRLRVHEDRRDRTITPSEEIVLVRAGQ